MSLVEKISQPVGVETPDVHQWRQSLRSPSPVGGGTRNGLTRSRSPSPVQHGRKSLTLRSPSPSRITIVKHAKGSYLTDVAKATQKKQSIANALRQSTGSMADFKNISKGDKVSSGQQGSIEAEYIRNLQQQVYFLELEANYLRDQTRKATEMHPQMVQEADRMLSKLRLMQQEMDDMGVELQRRESCISILTAEKERLAEQLHDLADLRAKDKRLLMDELVTLKTEKDRMERELNHKDAQLLEAKSSLDKSSVALTNAETKIQMLKAQLEQRIEQHKLTQLALEEKRTELVSMETQLREVEDKYYSSTVQIQDKVTQDLRDEIRFLRQKLKETEMSADKDRYLRDKINEDTAHLVRENATLNQQLLELEKQLAREKDLRESNEQRHASKIGHMVELRDKEGALQHEINKLTELLKHEQELNKQYLEQLSNKEVASNRAELKASTTQSRLKELEGLQQVREEEINQLKRDKVLLVEHVADLQRKVEDKERSLMELRGELGKLDSRLRHTEHQKSLELSAQSQRWEEFGRLAESMRTLSSTMAQSSIPYGKLQH